MHLFDEQIRKSMLDFFKFTSIAPKHEIESTKIVESIIISC